MKIQFFQDVTHSAFSTVNMAALLSFVNRNTKDTL